VNRADVVADEQGWLKMNVRLVHLAGVSLLTVVTACAVPDDAGDVVEREFRLAVEAASEITPGMTLAAAGSRVAPGPGVGDPDMNVDGGWGSATYYLSSHRVWIHVPFVHEDGEDRVAAGLLRVTRTDLDPPVHVDRVLR
jgi:hypothetical protein